MEQRYELQQDEVTIDLREIAFVLWRHILPILLAGLIGALLAFIISTLFITPEYRSTTKVYVLPQTTSNTVTNSDLTAGTQLSADYSELVKSRPVLETVIAKENLDMTTSELANDITVDTTSDTRIITIHVLNPDPKTAQDIANTLRDAVSARITSVMNVDVNTVEDANLPTSPYSPNIKKNTAIGGLAGLFIAVVIVILIYIFDDTIKTPEDVEQYLGLTNLGSIPMAEEATKKAKTKKRKKKKSKSAFLRG